ncbi:hypothetical protein [Microvirga rosea]|uniref:hypothetical protein n=1 Tax=Microvirga rosea TaxID=2715425 RepID=UPI001D0B5F18|nr:hypothetical protein [Microvirga rosea]MCB8819912.1 hypothetical protein [Microvirga rosea]
MAGLYGVVLFLVTAQTTQYLTIDDQVFVDQIASPADRGTSQWKLGAFHSGLLILVPVARLAQGFGASPVAVAMLLKAVWFGFGAVLLLAVARQTVNLLRPEREPVAAAIFMAGVLLLLPTTNLALKTVNYDLLSVVLSIAAALAAARALREGLFPAVAVVIATLAAQEKLSASPILVLIIVAGAAMAGGDPACEPPARRAIQGLRFAAGGILASVVVSIGSMLTYALLADAPLPPGFWMSWSDALASWTWVPIRFLSGSTSFITDKASPFGVGLVSILLAGAFARLVWPVLCRLGSARSWQVAVLLALVALFGCGLVGLTTVHAWWAPFHPGNPEIVGRYFPLNGAVIHFEAATLLEHFTRHGLYSAAITLASLPTAIVATTIVGVAALFAGHWRSKIPPVILAALPFMLLMIVAAAVFNVPVAHRYFNVALLGFALLLLAVHHAWTARLSAALAFAASAVVLAGAALEATPFRPTFASFRPIWLNYTDAASAQSGGLNPSWMGWGEEVMLIGKQLEDACSRNEANAFGEGCSKVVLRPFSYHGRWLPGSKDIKIEATFQVGQDGKMTANDYYVASRLGLLQLSNIPQIPPDFVVSYRGFVQAWAWRGDRLKAAGYTVGM